MKLAAVTLTLLLGSASSAQPVRSVYDRAVEARLAGDPARALALLEPLVVTNPGDADVQLQLGLALLGVGQLDEAEAAFRRTLALAPDYADARLGLARVHQRRGEWEAAQAEVARVDPAYPEAVPLIRQLEIGAAAARFSRWRVDVDGAHSFLRQGQEDWKEGSLHVTHWSSRATSITGGLEASRRFGFTDTYAEMRVSHRFPDNRGSAYVFAGGTPNANFRPEWQLGAGGEVRVRSGSAATLLTLDGRQAKYPLGHIQTLNPGVEQYLAKGRAWVGIRWINVFDQQGRHRRGWLLRGDLLATDRLRLFVGSARAPETSEGFVVNTSSLFGGVTLDVTERLSVRASLARDKLDIGADRLQLGLGAGVKF